MKVLFCWLLACMAWAGTAVTAQNTLRYYCPPCGGACDQEVFTAAGSCTHCGMTLLAQDSASAERRQRDKKIKVLFYLQDGVEVLDFAGPLEVFSYAGFEVSVVSRTKAPIVSQGVLTIVPEYSIDDAPAAGIIAFFGGNTGRPSRDSAVLQWLLRSPAPDYYFSVCTGAFILGRAGLLNNLTVTTFHESIDDLQKAVPRARVLRDVRFVDNGNIITTAGISAGIDGALHLVAKIRGRAMAEQVARYMEYDKWVPDQGLIAEKAVGQQP